jgi:hypothetical protein
MAAPLYRTNEALLAGRRIICSYNWRLLRSWHIQAVTLYPFILFATPRARVPEAIFRHELEHVYQVLRLGWLRFYFSYLWHYVVLRCKRRGGHHDAYVNIPFELEAVDAEHYKLTAAERAALGLAPLRRSAN